MPRHKPCPCLFFSLHIYLDDTSADHEGRRGIKRDKNPTKGPEAEKKNPLG